MSRIFDFQNQIAIRFPEDVAQMLNSYFQQNEGVEMPQVFIEQDRERQREVNSRIALKVTVGDSQYKATVMELPTISSSFKTIDHVNYFKSNDISEMIVVHENQGECENIFEEQAEKLFDNDNGRVIKYKCESGLTTPTKYIRQSNFKEKPEIYHQLVNQVDIEMEKIRYNNSQVKQGEKVEAKRKKLMMNNKS